MTDTEFPSKGVCGSRSAWPAIIFAIIALILLVGVAFSNGIDPNIRAYSFILLLILSILWVAIIYWFCILGYHALGWFLLLLPIAVLLLILFSIWLAGATAPKQCILGDTTIPYFHERY